jgi:cytochrome c oxidase assembly protein subunit 15
MPSGRRAAATPRPRAIATWLLLMAAMVFAMVVVGGITRLTESGLSMVRWEPISGIVPRSTIPNGWPSSTPTAPAPEYREINRGMSLAAFQGIYFWEYLHRVLGG